MALSSSGRTVPFQGKNGSSTLSGATKYLRFINNLIIFNYENYY